MSARPFVPLDVDRLAPRAQPGVRILPVVHDRVEVAAVVRAVLERLRPRAVAVELPPSLETATLAAIRRLPQLSVVVSEYSDAEASVWVAAPGEPFCEALRWAIENDAETLFIDQELPYAGRHQDRVPDPWSLVSVRPEEYFDLLRRARSEVDRSPADDLRDRSMAFALQEAAARLRRTPSVVDAESVGGSRDSDGGIVALVGAAHADPLARLLAQPVAQPLIRPRRAEVSILNLHPESPGSVLTDPPLAHAVWEILRCGDEPASAPTLGDTVKRPQSVVRLGLRLIRGGSSAEAEMARRRALVDRAATVASRGLAGSEGRIVDRAALATVVWQTARESYRERTQEEVARWQERLFFDFSRRCARLSGELVATSFHWVVAARGVADDNLAWEIFEATGTYPWQKDEAEIPTARIDGSDLDVGTRTIRFRRRHLRTKRRLRRAALKSRPVEDPDDWLRGFDSTGICSYPPEDLVIEDYGRFLQGKATALLSAERTRVEPFTVSLLDGIDLRETLRRWPEGRIYVREIGRAPGRAGSVVVIFDDDRDDRSYPYTMTWQGEHDQESDMAFYSTEPTAQVVGPGILRATYGGFMLSSPRGRMFDVWEDPDYAWLTSKADVLLLAAIDYSTEKLVVHAAPKPPSGRWQRYAASLGKRIVHLPLSALSLRTLSKIRVLHLLAGHDKRGIAKDYIW